MERSQVVKTADFDSAIRRFKSSRSNQKRKLTARKDEHNDSLDNRPPRGVSWVVLRYYQNTNYYGSVAQW